MYSMRRMLHLSLLACASCAVHLLPAQAASPMLSSGVTADHGDKYDAGMCYAASFVF